MPNPLFIVYGKHGEQATFYDDGTVKFFQSHFALTPLHWRIHEGKLQCQAAGFSLLKSWADMGPEWQDAYQTYLNKIITEGPTDA